MSVLFIDGPAEDQRLSLRRAPFLLRVTRLGAPGEKLQFDALDMVDDEPMGYEDLFAYVLIEGPTRCFIRTSKRGAGGLHMIATYKMSPIQPTDPDMRTRKAWVAWCERNSAALGWKPAEGTQ